MHIFEILLINEIHTVYADDAVCCVPIGQLLFVLQLQYLNCIQGQAQSDRDGKRKNTRKNGLGKSNRSSDRLHHLNIYFYSTFLIEAESCRIFSVGEHFLPDFLRSHDKQRNASLRRIEFLKHHMDTAANKIA